MRHTIAFGALAAAALSMFAGGALAQTKLTWAHVYEVTEPFHTESVWAAEEIAKRTDGRYEIQVFPASQLGKEADINQGLTLGTVDIIISGSSFQAREYPPIGVTYYPYIFRDAEHLIAYTKSDVFKRLAQGYEDKSGHHIAAVSYYGTRHTTANQEITECSDLAGVKMRVPDVPAYLAMPQACGANTAPIAFAEVYLALQNGTVDAQENPLTTIEAKKFYEVQTNIALTGHIVDHLNTVVSKTTWASLSDEDKAIFSEVMEEAAERTTKIIEEREAALVATFKERGINVTEVDKAILREDRPREEAGREPRLREGRLGRDPRDPVRILITRSTGAPAGAPNPSSVRRARADEPRAGAAHADHRRGDRPCLRGGGGAGRSLGLCARGLGHPRRLLGHGALRLPAVLHPLRAQQQPRLDRGDRDQLPRGRGLPRLGHVRAQVAPHPGRRALPLSAATAWRGCCRRSSTSSASASSPTRCCCSGATSPSSPHERMVTVDLPRSIVFYTVFAAFVLMLLRALQVAWRQLAPRLFGARAAGSLRRTGRLTACSF